MIFIHEYGMTRAQRQWWEHATQQERDSLILMAPLKIAVQGVIHPKEGMQERYLPTFWGIPVSVQGYSDLAKTPEGAEMRGLEYQRRCRDRLGDTPPLSIDLDVHDLRGQEAAEYATPKGRAEAFFAEALAGLHGGQLPKSEA